MRCVARTFSTHHEFFQFDCTRAKSRGFSASRRFVLGHKPVFCRDAALFVTRRTSWPLNAPEPRTRRNNSRRVATISTLGCSCAKSPMPGVLGRRPKLPDRQGSSWPCAWSRWGAACRSPIRFRVSTGECRPVEAPRGPPREAAAEAPARPRAALPEAQGPQAVRAARALGRRWTAVRRRSVARHFAA